MANNYNPTPAQVAAIISEIFGIAVYRPAPERPAATQPTFRSVDFVGKADAEAVSDFNLPVFGVVKFKGGSYNTYNERGQVVKQRMNDFVLPYSCIVDFSREKIITETQTLGGTGTVKELYGLGDWQINISGIAFGNRSDSSAEAHRIVAELTQWANICDSISVEGEVFGSKDIDNIVIKKLDIKPIEAKFDVIPFTIEAASDEPIELII
jgi:hypothetical protein|nr:MAG TPA: hypothetical protein [Bacteriophage sp.]